MQRLDFGAKGQHLHLIIDDDGPIDRRELANKRQGADQPFMKIVSLPGEKMVVDGGQLRLTRRLVQRQWSSASEKLLIFLLRPIRVSGKKFQHLSLYADRLKGRRRGVEYRFLDRESPRVIVGHNHECFPTAMRRHGGQDLL